MLKPAYYNEFDKYAAAWLRNLISAGHIAPGDVDERSIEDVRPDDLVGYGQCHFFAGVGVWSYALRCAGWADDQPIWTGSCPCQPFSSAGQGAGFADERHLWPAFFHLIEQRRPAAVLGEQVAGADADPWIDLVCADLERLGYAFGATPFPSAGVGAPHIRDRLYWAGIAGVALGDTSSAGLAQRLRFAGVPGGSSGADARQAAERAGVHAVRMADPGRPRRERRADTKGSLEADQAERDEGAANDQPRSSALRLAISDIGRREESHLPVRPEGQEQAAAVAGRPAYGDAGDPVEPGTQAGAVNGFWRDADWLLCRDGRWRPVEPGASPLATGAAARVGRLRAYGNAINAEAARVFIECVMECMPC